MDPPRCLLLLALLLGCGPPGAACQHHLLLRPVPSGSLPAVQLREDPDPLLDPRQEDLDEAELRGALGGHFDPRFMSASAPPEEPPAAGGDEPSEAELRLPGLLELEAPHGRKQKPSRRLRRRLQLWLWASALCPVVHAWTDLGSRFWPRYLRAGSCSSRRSCSVPEGMLCKPARTAHFTLLRWRCLQRRGGRRCSWIPVQYPVISECKCSC